MPMSALVSATHGYLDNALPNPNPLTIKLVINKVSCLPLFSIVFFIAIPPLVSMALCRNRLSEERKLWRKDHPYVRPHRRFVDSRASMRNPPKPLMDH